MTAFRHCALPAYPSGLIADTGTGCRRHPSGRQPALCAALAAPAAVLASLLPARRAARAPLVAALGNE
ncbi:hypothetical protein [Plantactinospora sp. WMMB782]|uniref:hypothetical protein n=1 Tax=Plantactinospora sp. WMMB782 TaxID=3404121 RepID=UPI003B92A06C